MNAFDKPKTATLRNLIARDKRIVGLSIEDDGVFIYTRTADWDDGAGSGTFRGDSETAAARKYLERVTRNTEGRH